MRISVHLISCHEWTHHQNENDDDWRYERKSKQRNLQHTRILICGKDLMQFCWRRKFKFMSLHKLINIGGGKKGKIEWIIQLKLILDEKTFIIAIEYKFNKFQKNVADVCENEKFEWGKCRNNPTIERKFENFKFHVNLLIWIQLQI